MRMPFTHRIRAATLAIAVTSLLAPAAARAAADAADKPFDFDAWANAVASNEQRVDPMGATRTQFLPAAELAQLDQQLTHDRPADRARALERAARVLAELARVDTSRLDSTQRASASLIEWSMNQRLADAPFAKDVFQFDQMNGLHLVLIDFMTQDHPMRNAADARHYVARLAEVAPRMDEGLAWARQSEAAGVLMPRYITEKVLVQFKDFLADDNAHNAFAAAFAERSASIKDLAPAERKRLQARVEHIVATQIRPAYARVQTFLQAELPHAPAEGGLDHLPDGAAAYVQALRHQTGTDDTPQQIHALGLAEVARITAEMDALFKQLGYTEGSIDERFAKLDADSQPHEADPRPALLARYQAILDDAMKRSREVFEIVPKAPLVVQREPALSEATASPHYASPARDGSRPGVFFATIPGPTYEITGMRTLAYHEGIPGHHFQIALQQESTTLPLFRRLYVFDTGSAFAEGWALYAEHLAVENGWYANDPRGHLGQLNDELLRARRLVADTGLHAFGWTRAQAVAYGSPALEVDRYVVWPGQACAYKLGMIRLQTLRDQARAQLGEKFSIKAFHTLVLQGGDVPLPVLDRVVADWVAAQAAR